MIINNAVTRTTINGVISGNGVLEKQGAGRLDLGGANTFSGGIELSNGRIGASNTAAFSGTSGIITWINGSTNTVGIAGIATGTTVVNNALNFGTGSGGIALRSGGTGANLEFTTSSIDNNTGTGAITFSRESGTGAGGRVIFSGTGFTVSRNVVISTNNAFVLSPSSGTQTWSGVFSGTTTTGVIRKEGAGTILFSGNSTHGARTSISAGTLLVNGAFNQTGGGQNGLGFYDVGTGGTLGGSGRIIYTNSSHPNLHLVRVADGGFVAPGAAAGQIGTLTLGGALTATGQALMEMQSGARFNLDLAGNGTSADRVDLWNFQTGYLILNNTPVNLTLTGTISQGTYTVDIFRFFSDDGTTAFTGTNLTGGLTLGNLDPLIDGTPTFTYNSGSIQLNYNVIPEPGVAGLVGLAGLMLLLRRRRQC